VENTSSMIISTTPKMISMPTRSSAKSILFTTTLTQCRITVRGETCHTLVLLEMGLERNAEPSLPNLVDLQRTFHRKGLGRCPMPCPVLNTGTATLAPSVSARRFPPVSSSNIVAFPAVSLALITLCFP
jgi:hypothetical protein